MLKKLLSLGLGLVFCYVLQAQTSLAGRITNSSGEAIIGAHVVLLRSNKGALTDENGRYVIDGVSIGAHQIKVSHISYLSLTRKINVPENTPRYLINAQMIEMTVEIDELIVKATRAGENTPMTYTNIKSEEFEKNNLGQDVPFLLRWTPSTVVTSDAGTGIGYSGIRIRGSDASRINVTVNGIPINDAESQGTFWVNMPDLTSSTNSIQIQRGVGTSTNGAGAFGATINLNTNKLKPEAYGQLSGSVGSFNTWKSNLAFGTGLIKDKFAFDGRLSRISSDGYIDRGSADLSSYFLSGVYMGKKSSLRFNVFSGSEVTYQSWNGVPFSYVDDADLRTFNSAGTEKSGTPHNNEVDDYTQTHYQAFFNHQFNPNLNLSIGLHYTKGEGFFEQYKADQDMKEYGIDSILLREVFFPLDVDPTFIENFVDEEDATIDQAPTVIPLTGDTLLRVNYSLKTTDLIRRRWLDNDFYGVTYALNYTSNSRKLNAILGGAWNQYDGQHFGEVIWARYAKGNEIGDRYYDNDAKKVDFNIFGKVNYNLSNSLNAYLDLQVRTVNYTFFGVNDAGNLLQQKDNLLFFNPKVGAFYDYNERTKFYASFAVANREPNRNDYTENAVGIRPKSESLYNTELGYRQSWNKAALSINLYHMYYQDQLAVTGQINDVGEATRTNIPSSYRAGIELVGGAELAPRLEFNASATFSQNKIKNFTEYVDNWVTGVQAVRDYTDTDLALSPNVIASGELRYGLLPKSSKKDLSIALLGKYVGKQYLDNTSNDNAALDPYFFSDLRINFNWKTSFIKEIGLTFTVRNLFDSQFSTNGWTYRFDSPEYDPRGDDPYARLEGGDTYNLTGLFPQAGRNYLMGLVLKF